MNYSSQSLLCDHRTKLWSIKCRWKYCLSLPGSVLKGKRHSVFVFLFPAKGNVGVRRELQQPPWILRWSSKDIITAGYRCLHAGLGLPNSRLFYTREQNCECLSHCLAAFTKKVQEALIWNPRIHRVIECGAQERPQEPGSLCLSPRATLDLLLPNKFPDKADKDCCE